MMLAVTAMIADVLLVIDVWSGFGQSEFEVSVLCFVNLFYS